MAVYLQEPQNNVSTHVYQQMTYHKGTLMKKKTRLHTTACYYRICMDIPLQNWIELKETIQQAKTLAYRPKATSTLEDSRC